MESCLIVPHKVARCKEYLKWTGTLEFKVWMYLQTYIVRDPDMKTGALNLYKDYYLKGKLVSRWSQENLAAYLGSDQGNISKALKRMESKKIIKIHKRNIRSVRVNIYEFGYHNFEDRETLYAHKFFIKMAAAERLSRFGMSKEHIADMSKEHT